MRFRNIISTLIVLVWALASPVLAQTFSGSWDTNMGAMQLQQSGSSLSGTYSGAGQVTGTVNGTYAQGTYVNGAYHGDFEFTLSADGNSFSGRWWRPGRESPWTGTRIGATPITTPQPTQPAPPAMGTTGAASPEGFWRVEDATDGRNYNYHPTPWQFMANGVVQAGTLWSGRWERQPDGTFWVQIIANGRVTDQFALVVSPDGRTFAASRGGVAYRYGDRM